MSSSVTGGIVRRPEVRQRLVVVAAVLAVSALVGAAVSAAVGGSAVVAVAVGAVSVPAVAGWLLLGRLPVQRTQAVRAAPVPIRAARAFVVLAVLILLAVAGASLLLSPAPFVMDAPSTTQYRGPVVAWLVLVLVGLLIGGRAVAEAGAAPMATAGRFLIPVLLVSALMLQVRLAWAVAQYPPFDAAQIFSAAYRISIAPGTVLFDQSAQTAYFSMLPNNAFLAAFFSAVFAALGGLGLVGPQSFAWASILTSVMSIDLAVVLLWVIARRIGSPFSTAITIGLAFLLVVVSPWLTVPYSDTLALAFPLAVVALQVIWPDSWSPGTRVLLWVSIGAITAVGYSVKPTVVFAAIGVLGIELLRARGPLWRSLVRVAGAAALVGVAFVVVHLAVVAWIDAVGVLPYPLAESPRALPFTHFLAMGAGGNGSYSQSDVNAALAASPAHRAAASMAVYFERVGEMGPLGYPLFLGRKLLFALSDGTFYQGREGVGDYDRAFFNTDPLSQVVQRIYPDFSEGHWMISSIWQAAWLVVLILCLTPLPAGTARRPTIVGLRVMVLLLLAFLLVSESRSRYIYLFLPFFLLLAGLGAEALTNRLASVVARCRRHPGIARVGRSRTIGSRT